MLCSPQGAFRRREPPHTPAKPACLLVYDPESLPEVTQLAQTLPLHKALITIPER